MPTIGTSRICSRSNYFAMAATSRFVFPVEFELPGDEAIMHRDGDGLVIEPVRKRGLVALLKTVKPLEEDFGAPGFAKTAKVHGGYRGPARRRTAACPTQGQPALQPAQPTRG